MNFNFYSDTSHKRTDEFDVEVLVTRRIYTDNGPSYPQEERYMRQEDLERFEVVRCTRCGRYMTGGVTRLEDRKRYCNDCNRTLICREILESIGN